MEMQSGNIKAAAVTVAIVVGTPLLFYFSGRLLPEFIWTNVISTLFFFTFFLGFVQLILRWRNILASASNGADHAAMLHKFLHRLNCQGSMKKLAEAMKYPWSILKGPLAPLILLGNILVILSIAGLITVHEPLSKPGNDADALRVISFGSLPLWETEYPVGRNIRRDAGNAYVIQLTTNPMLWAGQDSKDDPQYSQLVVYEDDKPLNASHRSKKLIREDGAGRYSHWGESGSSASYLYFSASDNTNPTENGHSYSIRYPLIIKSVAVVPFLLLSLPFYVSRGARIYESLDRLFSEVISGYNKRIINLFVITCALLIFSMPLLEFWLTGKTTYQAIGGLLPWSDASGWLYGASHLLYEGQMQPWSVRRPLNPVFIATLSFLTGENLQLLLLVRAVLAGLACFFMAREISRSHGPAAGVLSFAVLGAFASQFVAFTLSETLGLALGATGFAVMWQAIPGRDLSRYAAGLFLLTLGLSARPGPMLILPALALWAGYGMSDKRFAFRPFLMACAGVITGLTVTYLWAYFYGTGENIPAANYSFVMYGLAHGGESWQKIFIDYPEIKHLAEGKQAALAYKAAFDEIISNPPGLISGLGKFGAAYFDKLFYYTPLALQLLMKLFAGLGVLVAVSCFRLPHMSFVLSGAAGIVVSSPFVYWADDAYRTFISTAPFDAALVAIGLSGIVSLACLDTWTKRYSSMPDLPVGRHGRSGAAVLGGILVFCCTAGAAMAISLHHRPVFADQNCEKGLSSAIIKLGGSSPFIRIASNEAFTLLPDIKLDDFNRRKQFADVEIKPLLRDLRQGQLLVFGYNLDNSTQAIRGRWIIADSAQMPVPGAYYHVCGTEKEIPDAPQVTLVYSATEVKPVP